MLKTQIVDVSRSAIITDPEAFYENLMATGQEDAPEKTMPIVAYEGYNFLPTVYGYRSYFDVTPKVDIQALPSRCDKLINFQLSDYSNFLIALTETGIYSNPGKVSNAAWTLEVSKTAPPVGQYKEWTYCVIENKLYMYRQGDSTAHVKSNVPASSITTLTPSFLNMSGQMGIFRANGRLGFWDSANSISWSSLFDKADFTPTIETLAGNVTFNDVLGRIVSIKASGSGFVIYSTKNIVGAAYSTGGSILFDAKTIAETAGIWSSKQVCTGVLDTEHYAYTNTGIKHIVGAEKVENAFAPVYDFLKEARDPVYLDFLQGRYLFINVINPAYINGYVTFEQVDVPVYTVRLLYNGGECTVSPPAQIQGVDLTQALEKDIISGLTYGMYAQWNASGSKLIPSRTPSPMSPYQLDDPFTPEDDYPYAGNNNPLYTEAELIDARDNGYWISKFSVDNTTPSALALGWHDAPLGTGRTDAELTRMKGRQTHEWNEYYSLVNDLITEINTLSPTVTYKYPAGAFSLSALDNLLSTVDSGWVELGTLPDPSTTTLTEAFSGVGTYSPSYEYKNVYNKKIPIERRTVTSDAGPSVYKTYGFQIPYGSYVIGDLIQKSWLDSYLGVSSVLDSSIPIIPITNDNPTVNQVTWNNFITYVTSKLPATMSDGFGNTHGISSVVVQENGYNGFIRLDIAMSITGKYYGLWHIGGYDVYTTLETIIEVRILPQYKRKQSSDSQLRVTSAVSMSPIESKLTANQNVLDWGIYTVEAPPTGFNWSTNQQTVGSDATFVLSPTLPPLAGISYPGATFLLQDASPAAIFPDFAGALVYDTYLQKWGKMKASFRALIDYSPLNSNNNGSIVYSNFGLDAGILNSSGFVKLFSSECTDSKIRYGKFAMSRQGFTSIEYIEIKFRKPFTGTIQVDTSLDGRSIHSSLTQSEDFVGVGIVKLTPDYSGRWFIVTIIGKFDIRSIEFTGRPAGIR